MNRRPRYSPRRPSITNCTPEISSVAAISEAQPGGGARRIASSVTATKPTMPSEPSRIPATTLIRSGIAEKLMNRFSQSRTSRRTV